MTYIYIYIWTMLYSLGTRISTALLRGIYFAQLCLNLKFIELQAQYKLIMYRDIHENWTQGLYITAYLPTAWLLIGSNFDQLCLNINFIIELQGHGGLPFCTYAYGTSLTHSNAAGQIKFWSTVFEPISYQTASSEWVALTRLYINVHMTNCLSLAIWSPTEWLRNR